MAYGINRLRQQNIFGNYGIGQPENPMQGQPNPFSVAEPPAGGPFSGQRNPFYEPSSPPSTPKEEPSEKGGITSSRIEDLVGLTNRIYTPSTTDRDRFRGLLDDAPQMNKPGLMRALVAGTTAFGANAKGADIQNISDRVMYSPYLRDKTEWETKTKPFYDAASLENTANINERTLAGNLVTNFTTGERNAATERYNQDRLREIERNNREKARIDEIKATAQAFKLRNPDWTIKEVGPRMIAYSPDGSQQRDLGESYGMSKRDEIELEGGYKIAAAAATGSGMFTGPNGETLRVDPKNPNKMIAVEGAPAGGLNRIGTPQEKSAAQIKTERNEMLSKIYYMNPQYQDLFNRYDNGDVEIKPRPQYGLLSSDAADEAKMKQWDDLMTLVDPSYKRPVYRSQQRNQQPPQQTRQQPSNQQQNAAAQTISGFGVPGTNPSTLPPPPNTGASMQASQQRVQEAASKLGPNEVLVIDLETKELVAVPKNNLEAAIRSKRYMQVR